MVDGDVLFYAEACFLKGQIHVVADVSAALRRVRVGALTAKSAAEKAVEDVAHIKSVKAAAVTAAVAAGGGIKGGVTELVILLLFFRVAQHLVGLRGFFKLFFGTFLIVRI